MKNEQDLRKMGGAISYLPMTYVAMLLASFSLSGVPFFTGFYSKDHILEVAASQYTILSSFVFWVAVLTEGVYLPITSTHIAALSIIGYTTLHYFSNKFHSIDADKSIFSLWSGSLAAGVSLSAACLLLWPVPREDTIFSFDFL